MWTTQKLQKITKKNKKNIFWAIFGNFCISISNLGKSKNSKICANIGTIMIWPFSGPNWSNLDRVLEGSRRFQKVPEGSRRFQKVLEGFRGF